MALIDPLNWTAAILMILVGIIFRVYPYQFITEWSIRRLLQLSNRLHLFQKPIGAELIQFDMCLPSSRQLYHSDMGVSRNICFGGTFVSQRGLAQIFPC